MARDGSVERGSEVKATMMRALADLEDLVREGRESLAGARSRQEEVGRDVRCCFFSHKLFVIAIAAIVLSILSEVIRDIL